MKIIFTLLDYFRKSERERKTLYICIHTKYIPTILHIQICIKIYAVFIIR